MTGRRLESWKEIASYLGRQVRTVQGWEKNEGLPVHRLQHQKLGSVFAYPHELDAWMAERTAAPLADEPAQPLPVREKWNRPRTWAVAATVVVVSVAVGWRLDHANPAPVGTLALTQRYFAASTSLHSSIHWLPGPPGAGLLSLGTDGRRLIAASGSGQTDLIDPRSAAILRQWNLPAPVSNLILSPDGGTLYALSGGSQVLVVNVRTGRVRAVHLEAATAGMSLSSDGRLLYVALPYSGVDRIDTATDAITHWSISACPEDLALSGGRHQLVVSFQCGGPGGTSGHDAIAIVDTTNGAILSHIAGPPRVGSPLAVSPDGNEIWTNSDAACASPQFDHRGCPFVPSILLETFSTSPLALAHILVIPAGAELPQFGSMMWLPGGERILDGSFVISATRYARLEVLSPRLSGVTSAAVAPDGSHLYLVTQSHPGIADFTPTSAACSPPTLQLADWWPGDGSADDAWGVVNARPSPAAVFAPGQVGQAFDLARPGAYLTLGPDDALDFRLSNITATAWVEFSSPGVAPIFDKTGSWFLGRDAGGRLQFCPDGLGHPGCLVGTSQLVDSRWYHVALTAAASGALTLYLNGRREAAALPAPLLPVVHTALYVGADPARHRFLQGGIDELMLYQRALSVPELQQLVRMPACIAAAARP